MTTIELETEVDRLLAEEAAQRRAELATLVQERREREQAQQAAASRTRRPGGAPEGV